MVYIGAVEVINERPDDLVALVRSWEILSRCNCFHMKRTTSGRFPFNLFSGIFS